MSNNKTHNKTLIFMFKKLITTALLLLIFTSINVHAYDDLTDKQEMDLNKACNNQYDQHDENLHAYTANYSDPWSWECRNSDQKILGGVDLHAYCKSRGHLSYFLLGDTAYNFVCAKPCYNVVHVESATRYTSSTVIVGGRVYVHRIPMNEYIHTLSNGSQITLERSHINECITL